MALRVAVAAAVVVEDTAIHLPQDMRIILPMDIQVDLTTEPRLLMDTILIMANPHRGILIITLTGIPVPILPRPDIQEGDICMLGTTKVEPPLEAVAMVILTNIHAMVVAPKLLPFKEGHALARLVDQLVPRNPVLVRWDHEKEKTIANRAQSRGNHRKDHRERMARQQGPRQPKLRMKWRLSVCGRLPLQKLVQHKWSPSKQPFTFLLWICETLFVVKRKQKFKKVFLQAKLWTRIWSIPI